MSTDEDYEKYRGLPYSGMGFSFDERIPEDLKKDFGEKKQKRIKLLNNKIKWNEWAVNFLIYLEKNKKDPKHYCIDFGDHCYDYCRFDDRIYPVPVYFNNSIFRGNVNFSNSIFHHDFHIENSIFHNGCNFERVTFKKHAIFSSVFFGGHSRFERINFSDVTSFTDSFFDGECYFYESIFSNHCYFYNSRFMHNALFNRVFFEKSVSFNKSCFNKHADFKETTINTIHLDEVLFTEEIPDFRYSEIKKSPEFFEIKIPKKHSYKKDNEGLYRVLRRMAIRSFDHEKELYFFSCELAEKRKKIRENNAEVSHPLETGINILGIIPYYFYSFFSRNGQSIFRPALSLIVVWYIFGLTINISTYNREMTDKELIELSVQSKKLHLVRNYDCRKFEKSVFTRFQYTLNYSAQVISPLPIGMDPEREKVTYCIFREEIPNGFFKITEVIIKVFGSIFIFLLGLGIRNRFKIK